MTLVRSKHRVRATVAIAIVCAVILPVLPQAFWDRMSTVALSEDKLQEDDDSSRGRLHFWRVAVQMANANPIFGVGHNAFNPSYDTYDFLDGRYGVGRAVHSTWFGIVAELGYIGLLLFVLNLVFAFIALTRVRRAAARGEVPEDFGIYARALETSLVVFCVGGTFLSYQYVEMLWHFVGLSTALALMAAEFVHAPVEQPATVAPVAVSPILAPVRDRARPRAKVRFTVSRVAVGALHDDT